MDVKKIGIQFCFEKKDIFAVILLKQGDGHIGAPFCCRVHHCIYFKFYLMNY